MWDPNIHYRRFWRSCGYIYPVYEVWTWAEAQSQLRHCMDTGLCWGTWIHCVSSVWWWHKRPSAPRLSFLKGWPSHPEEDMQLAVKLQASSASGLGSCRDESRGMKKFSVGISPHPPVAASAEVIRSGLWKQWVYLVGQPSLHHPTSQKARYSSLSLQLPRKETKL